MTTPARTLAEVFRAASLFPLESGDPRYVDLTAVRGEENAVKYMADRIERLEDEATTQLFTGHLGSGKSTELRKLKKELEDRGYFVSLLDAVEEIDLADVEYTDILLAVARGLERDLRGKGLELDSRLLDNIAMWFAEVVYVKTDKEAMEAEPSAEVKVGVSTPPVLPFLARVLGRISGQVKSGTQIKKEIRRRLGPQISLLIDNINLLLAAASAAARKRGRKGPAIIFDNLEHMVRLEKEEGRNSHDAIYIEHGRQLSALDCHKVYTVPLSMLLTTKATVLTNIFPSYCILPMVKIREKGGKKFGPGYDKLRDLVGRRISAGEVFAPAVVDSLIGKSGGSPRDLLRLIQYCCEWAADLPIDKTAARRAVAKIASEFRRAIPEHHYELLARVHKSKDVKGDADHQMMLYNTSVLEYMNGELWHDVHPAVLELPKFKEALARDP